MKQFCRIPERTLRAMAAGRRPHPATVREALSGLRQRFGCEDPLPILLDLANSRLRKCQIPGCDATARMRSTTCSERHRKALSRLSLKHEPS
jgi:hypothetical protein